MCGGGTAGCIAAIASAREGAKTLLIERSFVVGGMLTVGEAGITKFTEHCHNSEKYRKEVIEELKNDAKKVQVAGGIAHEYVMRLINNGDALGSRGEAGSYVFTDKAAAQWIMMQMLEEAGVTVLYDSRVCLVNKDENKITGVTVLNREGFTLFEAPQIIDATGDGDVAFLAGAAFNKGATEEEVKLGYASEVGETQGAGVMYRVRNVDFKKLFEYLEENPDRFFMQEFGVMSFEDVKESYERGDMCVFRIKLKELSPFPPYDLVQFYNLPEKDEAILLGPGCGAWGNWLDAMDVSNGQYTLQYGAHKLTEVFRNNIPGFENVRITYIPDICIRETRHIIGEYLLDVTDVLSGKRFEDSIACGGHPIDIHPLPPEVEHVDLNHWRFYIPYRIMLPKGVDNLTVTGRCVSASRGASGAIRPTVQCMAMGEAAGTAAAMAFNAGVSNKEIDVSELQKKLTENGAIL